MKSLRPPLYQSQKMKSLRPPLYPSQKMKSLRPSIYQSQKMKTPRSSLYQSQKSRLENRFFKRRELLQKSCQKHYQYFHMSTFRKQTAASKTNVQKRVSICTTPKAATMFWMRMLTAYNRIPDTSLKKSWFVKSTVLPQGLYRSTIKYTFVRNPYTRLLSGYVDKIFSVNPHYWKGTGYHCLKVIRYKNRTLPVNTTCGTDITFAEFVDYILHRNGRHILNDNHFVPIHRQCAFCASGYDYIGKMETFVEDMVYVAEALGMMKHNSTREVVVKEGLHGVDGMFYRNARNLFGVRRKGMEECGVIMDQGLRVTWKRWQIRGMISMEIPFPAEAKRKDITYTQFVELALNAHSRSDPNVLLKGKQMALREAYGTLTYETKVTLRTFFEPEFEMFDYDSTPEFVFGEYKKAKFSFFHNKFG
ncbi:carbohydrate sulfotransferase 13-like [Haliotis asinina]|uniref:carbohydrate sulfotransferase 13-like n=1 Tax=Haliotis asinina TaxID=109174 RepID=UPI0035318C03